MDQNTRTEADAIIEAARVDITPHALPPGRYGVTMPEGYVHEAFVVRGQRPDAVEGTTVHRTLQSFVDYVSGFDGPNNTVWVEHDKPRAVSVLDDHVDGIPEWGLHRALLDLDLTPEWKHWTSRDCQSMDQVAFAEHLEDGMRDIVEPDAATLLEVVKTVQAATAVQFRQASRLDNGEVQFTYAEEINASAGKSGQLTIPQEFLLGIPPYVGCDRYKLTARFRYRLREGKLSLSYKLDRPDVVLRSALDDIATTLGDSFDRVYRGTPREAPSDRWITT